jgi:hypothetical protein
MGHFGSYAQNKRYVAQRSIGAVKAVQHLPGNYEALSSNPSTAKRKKSSWQKSWEATVINR